MLRSILTAFTRLTLLGTTLLIGACASAPNTYSNVDSAVDFTRYKTFGYYEKLATDKKDYESTESRYLKAAVTREMESRGFIHAESPDLKINFYIESEEKIRSRQTPSAGGYYGYRGSYYGAWGGYETRIDQYTEGTLNIDVVDPRTEKLVWEGAMVGKITQEVLENLEAAINEAVAVIYMRFPVQAVNEIPAPAQ